MHYECPHLHKPLETCTLLCICGHECKQHPWNTNADEESAWRCDVDGCDCEEFTNMIVGQGILWCKSSADTGQIFVERVEK